MKRLAYIFYALLMALVPSLSAALPAVAAKPPPPNPWPVVWSNQTRLDATSIPKFVDQLSVLDATGKSNGTMQTVDATTPSETIEMREFKANILPHTTVLPGNIPYSGTWAWGYLARGTAATSNRDTYIGPVIVAKRGTPSSFTFVNNLPSTATVKAPAYNFSTDQSIHWANPNMVDKYVLNPFPPYFPTWIGNPNHYAGGIPATVHLHGAEDPAAIDGGPESWFTSDGSAVGKDFYSMGWDGSTPQNYATYRFLNVQEAAPLWFHDHVLGVTRVNVYMGLAGAYDLIDPNLTLPKGLAPLGLYRDSSNADRNTPHTYAPEDLIIPLVIQDRSFDTNGQLLFSATGGVNDPTNPPTNPEHPYWSPEFFGDTIVMNGKTWPYLDVQAQRYRFYMINGSNARSYILSFKSSLPNYAPGYTAVNDNGKNTPTIYQISTDGGYLDKPVAVDPLVIMPGERADFIIDFGGMKTGTTLVLNNFGPDVPLNVLPVDPVDQNNPATTGQVMQFKVVAGAPATDNSFNPAAKGAAIRTGNQKIVRLVNPMSGTLAPSVTASLTRQLNLVEIARDPPTTVNGITFPGGPLEVLLNNSKWNGLREDANNPNAMMSPPLTPINGSQDDGNGNWLTEFPKEGATEVWEFVNTTMDSHPIHIHLVQFQIMNRQAVNMGDMGAPAAGTYADAYSGAFPGGSFIPAYGPPLDYAPSADSGGKYGGNPSVTPYLNGPVEAPLANEAGWKDTIRVPPGMVTRVVVRWAPTDIPTTAKSSALFYPFEPNDAIPGNEGAIFDYVWHCHILDHEDNEMMRPDAVIPNSSATRTYVIGTDY